MGVTYETHTMKDVRLPFICRETFCAQSGWLGVGNWHENVEIIFIREGKALIALDDERFAIEKDDIIAISANRLHNIYLAEGELKYDYLIIDRAFFLANHFDSNHFYFNVPIRDKEIATLLDRFKTYWLSDSAQQPMRIQKIRATALKIAIKLCERHATFERSPREPSHLLFCIKKAIGYIRTESGRDLSLQEVADFVGLSKYYFAREFKRITGYSFVPFLNMIRCQRAAKLLTSTDTSISEIGRQCGFSDHSYFTRTFRKYIGTVPANYRKITLRKSCDL